MTWNRRTLRKTFFAVGTIGAFPPKLLHELTHVVFALPFASSVGLLLYPDVHVAIDWIEDVPRWGVRTAQFAPLVLGLLVGGAAILYTLTYDVAPQTTADYLAAGYLAVYWYIYTKPSAKDLEVET
jgi:hypothetical protein